MSWPLDNRYASMVADLSYLAAKDYLIVNGVWQTDANGNKIQPFDGLLPAIQGFDVDAMKGPATATHEKFKTCDALCFPDDDVPCLIEFKDQNVRNINQTEVMGKCWGSLVVLKKTLLNQVDFSALAKGVRLIVVFSSAKSNILQFLKGKAGLDKDSFGHAVCWDLDYYTKVGLFSSVHSWSISQFNEHLSAIGF